MQKVHTKVYTSKKTNEKIEYHYDRYCVQMLNVTEEINFLKEHCRINKLKFIEFLSDTVRKAAKIMMKKK